MSGGDVYRSLSEAGRAHGVSPQAACRWKDHPKFPCKRGGRLDRAKVDAFVKGFILPKRKTPPKGLAKTDPVTASPPAVPEVPAATSGEEDGGTAEGRLKKIRGASDLADIDLALKRERAHKEWLANQEREGRLMDANRVRRDVNVVMTFLRTSILNLPGELAGKLEGLSSLEAKAVMEGRLIEFLGELKRRFDRVCNRDA